MDFIQCFGVMGMSKYSQSKDISNKNSDFQICGPHCVELVGIRDKDMLFNVNQSHMANARSLFALLFLTEGDIIALL